MKAFKLPVIALLCFSFLNCVVQNSQNETKNNNTLEAGVACPSNATDVDYNDAIFKWNTAAKVVNNLMKRADLTVNDLDLPDRLAVHYNTWGQNPPFDYLMKHPTRMVHYAADLSNSMNQHKTSLKNMLIQLAGSIHSVPSGIPSIAPSNNLDEVYTNIRATFGLPIDDRETYDALESFKNLDSNLKKPVAIILNGILEAAVLRKNALEVLTDEEKDALLKYCPSYFNADPKAPMSFNAFTGPVEKKLALLDALNKMPIYNMIKGSLILADAIDEAKKMLEGVEINLKENFKLNTPLGLVILGNAENSIYNTDATLIVDLGGDDIYLNNCAGSIYTKSGIAVILDLKGNDKYDSKRHMSVASGFLGVGILADCAGDDIYSSGKYTQGTGFGGVGLLADYSGNDIYSGVLVAQGGAIFGLGLLADFAGNDSYNAGAFAQGFASTMGAGVLADFGGDDKYLAGEMFPYSAKQSTGGAQGFATGIRPYPWKNKIALYGGVAALLDYEGNDSYQVKDAYGQGSSYLFSIGMLVDTAGDDSYKANDFAQGSGTHLSAGVLVDYNGNDTYLSTTHSQGASLDRSHGILFDVAGNDSYTSPGGGIGFAVKPISSAIFVDYDGDDKYSTNKGLAWSRPPSEYFYTPRSFFLDLGGNDTYPGDAAHVNNSQWMTEKYAVGMDADLTYKQNMEKFVKKHYSKCKQSKIPPTEDGVKYVASYLNELLDQFGAFFPYNKCIQSQDIFIRSFAITNIINKFKNNQKDWKFVQSILEDERYYVRRAGVDLLGRLYVLNLIDSDAVEALDNVLNSKSSKSKRYVAIICGNLNMSPCAPSLLNALNDEDEKTVCSALVALGKIQDANGLLKIKEFSVSKKPNYRIAAMKAASYYIDNNDALDILIKGMRDKNPGVASVAAYYIPNTKSKRVVDILTEYVNTDNVYLRYAVVYSLMNMKETWAFKEYIQFLGHPNSTRRGEVLLTLQKLSGQNLGPDMNQWYDWWEDNKKTFSLKDYFESQKELNVVNGFLAKNDFEKAFAKYEEILKKYPNVTYPKLSYALALNSRAWALTTSLNDPAQGLKLAERAVSLAPENTACLDTYAESLYRMGNIEKAIEIATKAMKINNGKDPYYAKQVKRFTASLEHKDDSK